MGLVSVPVEVAWMAAVGKAGREDISGQDTITKYIIYIYVVHLPMCSSAGNP